MKVASEKIEILNLENYYIDITALFLLDNDKSHMIINLYNQMNDCLRAKEWATSQSLFNTLLKSGYLKCKTTEEREEKIDLING